MVRLGFEEMRKAAIHLAFAILTSLLFVAQGFCLDSNDIAKLREAGVDAETIQVIIKEKIIETCAFTVDEIVDLKNAGLGNAAVRTVIESASFMNDVESIEYGEGINALRFTTVEDLIDLKNAGISDEVIQSIVSGIMDDDIEGHQSEWKMLEEMGIIIDRRKR